MNFNLIRVYSDSIPHFEASIKYTHGFSDYIVRHDTVMISSGDFYDLEKYISKFNELRDMIEANRSDGIEYPVDYRADIEDYCSSFEVEGIDNVSIDLINDETVDEFDCFARMEITEIFYYNEQGEKFKVEIT